MKRNNQNLLLTAIAFALTLIGPISSAAQTAQTSPLTSGELRNLVYRLPKHPELRDEIVEEIRNRGLGFPLTEGMRSLVATKSGNDALLRRTLEEAERRRVNPTASARPPDAEATELLERTRTATLAAAAAMPDFLVKQLIKRSYAFGKTNNWIPQDNLAIAVGYRANGGEQYKVLSVNGRPMGQDVTEGANYTKYVGGTTSTGVEYISAVADVFKLQSRTEFKVVDTDLISGRRTLVYEYQVEKPFSNLNLTAGGGPQEPVTSTATVGSRGRVWIDRETNRVLRFEQLATEIPPGFPITAARSLIDYDWVTINENKYLLPTHSEILLSDVRQQTRNEISFRNYQRFGAELKLIEEIDEKDFLPDKPEKP